MIKWRETCVLSFLLMSNVECNANTTDITIRQGKLRGAINENGNYTQFFGIPYASAPERFQEPGEPPSWNGTLNASEEPPKCIQYSPLLEGSDGQEICLFLNLYTPITKQEEPVAVIVFFHGGAYKRGGNADLIYNAKYLIQKNVIVVTVNSRLGAFGLLCLNRKGAAGNMVLKDQKAALLWVRDNIIQFGGNPNCVTVMGSSSGASTINYFLFNNSAKGLFHRAIMHGGSMVSPHKIDKKPIETASAVALRMGYNTSDPDQLLQIFKNADANDIIKASYKNPTNDVMGGFVFKPCVENSSLSENAIITEPVRASLKSSRLDPNIDIIMGYNNKEGLCWSTKYNSTGLQTIQQNLADYIPLNFNFRDDYEQSSFIEDLKEFYFKNSSTGGSTYDELTDFFSDCFVMYPSLVITEALLNNGNNLYNYYFEYDSRRNLNKLVLNTHLSQTPGASHADELYYIFDSTVFKSPNPQDLKMINTLTTLWTNFAKTGIPSSSNVSWHRSDKEVVFLDINEKFEMIPMPNKERIDFWKRAHEKYSTQ